MKFLITVMGGYTRTERRADSVTCHSIEQTIASIRPFLEDLDQTDITIRKIKDVTESRGIKY
jgi:hypothetical protein